MSVDGREARGDALGGFLPVERIAEEAYVYLTSTNRPGVPRFVKFARSVGGFGETGEARSSSRASLRLARPHGPHVPSPPYLANSKRVRPAEAVVRGFAASAEA